ncbi:CRP-like cAMP-binding protein [Pseudochelatococcus lubricantis]|uniref:CRP-like cAMP-binding protein n=1 Tax=Pseudochelatococcus lubricantis TaxID=1538102 RepID=A0ABX0V107_9HYPH|nr:Crp/Fnr family transcriptional regulator [Pseudochelatococcus lubricantis]NIJ57870.1 CRP-like cAMP-binding protein [Pseudochelatococcus lubricantis]
MQPFDIRRDSLGDLPVKSIYFPKGAEIQAVGSVSRQFAVVGDGIAMRYRLLSDGGRQIIMFLMPGDACNTNFYNVAPLDYAVAAVTPVRIDRIEYSPMLALVKDYPEVNQALWLMASRQEAIMRDWITSLGRCDARRRVAILLRELVQRLRESGEESLPVPIPITQSLLADAVGVTPIHFNRVINELGKMQILTTRRGTIFVSDTEALSEMATY